MENIFSLLLMLSAPVKGTPYLDPGSGSFILQILIASLAGILIVFRGYIMKFFNLFRKSKGDNDEDDFLNEDDGDDDHQNDDFN
ncbi:MAG: hypothetical protein JXB38_13870 [Anaerolineales bacterium]|nr:hypothetical protein [Anaerolineales bacterium]